MKISCLCVLALLMILGMGCQKKSDSGGAPRQSPQIETPKLKDRLNDFSQKLSVYESCLSGADDSVCDSMAIELNTFDFGKVQ